MHDTAAQLDPVREAPVGLALLDADLRIVRVNAALAAIRGEAPEALVGECFLDLLPGKPDLPDELRRVREVGDSVTVELSGEAPGAPGATRTWRASFYPVHAGGRVAGVGAAVVDVTDQRDAIRALRDSEERFRSLFTRMTEAFALGEVIVGADGAVRDIRLLEMNEAFERQTGLRRAQVKGRPIREVLPNLEQGWLDVYGRVATTGEPERFELYNRDVDRRFSLYAFSPSRGRFAVLFSDVSDRERATEEVRHAAELLDLGDALLEVDAGWRIVRVNANQERLSRRPRAETVGRVLWEVWPELVTPDSAYWREYHRCMAERVPVQFDAYFAPLDLWTGVAAYPTSGGGIAVFFRDVGDRKRAEEALRASEERLRLFVAHAPAAVAMFDREMRYLAVSDRFLSDYRLGGQDLVGRSHYDVFPELPQRWREVHRRCLEGAVERSEEDAFERADGTMDWMRWEVVPWRDARGAIGGLVLFSEDITERKRAEEALRAANDRLRDSDRRKDEFLGMLSHELRNPLAPIRNALYILERADPAGSQARRAREVASRQVAHLTRLVDDLLDVTRIARGKIALRRAEVDVAALARRTAEDHRALMAERGLTLGVATPDEPVVVNGDETRLAQVLGNLLSNAAKFTPGGGRVDLAVREEGGEVVIRVRDTGAGIEPGLLESVFEPFTQGAQTLARTEGGLGLGLALVKGLVALHGGAVTAASEGPGRGTEIVVRLPSLRSRAAAPGDAAPGARAATRRRRVLVVDDNRDAAETLAQLVRLFGHDADVAYDGPTAVARARDSAPDLVLCDIGLPGMSGYDVARALRAGATSGVRLVAVSGYAQPEDVKRALDAGFDAHVAKPADPAEIERLLS